MKVLPPALRNGLLRMRWEGSSFRTIAKAFGVKLGTVKSVCSKAGVKKSMEPRTMKEKTAGTEPPPAKGTGGVHRGLRLEDMPGRSAWQRRMTFAMFKRRQWPPHHWHIPATAEGVVLRELLMERAAKSVEPAKPRGGTVLT